MERNKAFERLERERQQKERERHEKKCNAEQAVSKHFEESLRRAEEKKMRSAWTINTIPVQHLNQTHMSSNVVNVGLTSQSPSSNQQSQQATNISISATKNTNTHHLQDERRIRNGYERIIAGKIEQSCIERDMVEMQQTHRNSEAKRIYYQQPALSVNTEYIPQAHISIGQSKVVDKLQQNNSIYGYNYTDAQVQPYQKDLKTKGDLILSPPPPLINQQSTGVIVKHDTHKSTTSQIVHSSSKLIQQQQQSQYQSQQQPTISTTHHKTLSGANQPHIIYEYRQASPHERFKTGSLPNSPAIYLQNSHHIQSQQNQQQTQIHLQNQNHHQQQAQSQQQQQQQQQQQVHHSILQQKQVQAHVQNQSHYTTSQNKPKVSSPAPSHIYGRPGGASIIPVFRAQEPSAHAVTKSSDYIIESSRPTPPPAHSTRIMYNSRLYSAPVVKMQPLPLMLHGTSPPTASSEPLLMSRSPGISLPPHTTPSQITISSTSFQTQPLDLGVSDRNLDDSNGLKRKATPIDDSQLIFLNKRPIILNEDLAITSDKVVALVNSEALLPAHFKTKTKSPQTQPSSMPLINANIAIQNTVPVILSSEIMRTTNAKSTSTTINADVIVNVNEIPSISNNDNDNGSSNMSNNNNKNNYNNTINGIQNTLNNTIIADATTLPSIVQTSNNSHILLRTNSADGLIRPLSENSSPAPSPGSAQSAPGTPAKIPNEPEKSSSPAFGAPRHLKKAWLQRHTGEDYEDTTGVTGGGNCVKLPLTLNTPSTTQSTILIATTTNTSPQLEEQIKLETTVTTSSPIPSLNIASMAVNSINKSKSIGVNKALHRKKTPENTNLFAVTTVISTRNNGYNSETEKHDDSSSSDQPSVPKTSTKRKYPRSKRRKRGFGKSPEKRKKAQIAVTTVIKESDKESGDSDKESMSDRDSDSTSKTLNGDSGGSSKDKEPIKRGRRPKESVDSAFPKKKKLGAVRDPFRKPPISQLKKTGESFLQDGDCSEVAPKLAKCRECRWTANQRSKNTSNVFCRFYAFRKLRYTKTGTLAIAGFSDPHKDPTEDDLKLWMPDVNNPPKDLDLSQARFLLTQVADQFCDLLAQEKMAMSEHMSDNKVVAWKRVIQKVREMCDVCETTLFNYHWACGKCGFVVCIDCYKARKYGEVKIWNEGSRDRDDFFWLLCTNRGSHEQEKLMLTQIIAGDSLQVLGRLIHEIRALWGIPQLCDCLMSKEAPSKATNGACKELIKSLINAEQMNNTDKNELGLPDGEPKTNILTDDKKSELLIDAAAPQQNEVTKKENKETDNSVEKNSANNNSDGVTANLSATINDDFSDSSSSADEAHSTLRELLIRPNKLNSTDTTSPEPTRHPITKPLKKLRKQEFEEIMANSLEPAQKDFNNDGDETSVPKIVVGDEPRRWRRRMATRIMTLSTSRLLYPDIPHSWLCDGKLLRLLNPSNPGNIKIFQEQWKRGQPVIVSEVINCMNRDLWRPESFSKDFGEEANDLINCMTGTLVPNQPMKRFWDGFEYINKRIKDDNGEPMLLKLKDWPPGEDFAEILPTRFTDLMKSLPLSDYSKRNGKFNLASRLPDVFVKPDLGPKMYNAYGSALHPTKGTTNLHLDISDAVNVMVYVGIPKDTGDDDSHIKEAYRAIDDGGCDILTRRRVRDRNELPGALWHIYAPRDADKIRDLLNKVAIECGERLEPNHDAIHDQSWYLDSQLRERLYKEYNVEGYPIAQCLGDAVFIPAGAPHQVRNLHNCIKVAEDFVSPENVSECFELTHEFRSLSDTHSNHEDKLQIKNIIYHAVKDALACLSHILDQSIADEQSMDIKTEAKEEPNDA